MEKNEAYYQALTDSINANSNADFINRLKSDTLKTIPNWEDTNQISSHKLSYVTGDGGKSFVYPNIQMINGELHDFTDPKHKHGKWDAWNNALKNGDYVKFDNEEDAAWWSNNNYKKYYKSTNKYFIPSLRSLTEKRKAITQ